VRLLGRPLRRFRIDPIRLDAVIAIALAIGCELEVFVGGLTSPAPAVVAIAGPLMAATVLVRRRWPAAAGTAAALLANAVAIGWHAPSVASYAVAWMCSMYALAVWTRRAEFALGLAATGLPPLAAEALGEGPRGGLLFTTVTIVVMVLVRRVIGDRERRAQLAERERDVAAQEAVVAERARIARELHDAIAHNVSMMVVQAGGERSALDESSGTARQALETIERVGREALTEMRRLVGMLRTDVPDPLAPQPSLKDLPTLVAQVREAGLRVELQVDGDRRELPVGIELSAFRIVQEALTNALKHAGHASARVKVTYGPDSLQLEIMDDGPGSKVALASGGHGLVGMRERVALYGGRFDAGRRPSGGFSVRVLLPTR
jgi:signal transduction histidine kinase